MTFLHIVAAEARKTAALPATLVALGVAVLGPVAITLLNAVGVRNAVRAGRPDLVAYTAPAESVFSAVPLGTVGAVILGVVAVGSSTPRAAPTPAAGGRSPRPSPPSRDGCGCSPRRPPSSRCSSRRWRR